MDDMQLVNCRYCGSKIPFAAPVCSQCGGPNEPEPAPWYLAFGVRLKAALAAKNESVWADRLAALMPLQFVFSAITLYLGLNQPKGFLVALISVAVMLLALVYYPGWYKVPPEKRKEYGLVIFVVTLAQLIIIYKMM